MLKTLLIISLLTLASCASTGITDYYLSLAEGKTPEEAIEIYERGLTETNDSILYYNTAYTYLQLGDYSKAIALADEALSLYPSYIRFNYLKVYAYRESGMYYSYEEELKNILTLDEGNNNIRTLLAEYYADRGYEREAVEYATEAVRRDRNNTRALSVLANYIPFYKSIANERETKTADTIKKPVLYDFSSYSKDLTYPMIPLK